MMKSLLVATLVLQASVAPKFDSSRAWEHLRQLVAIGPRPSGSPAIEQTRKYIKDQLASAGLTALPPAATDGRPSASVQPRW